MSLKIKCHLNLNVPKTKMLQEPRRSALIALALFFFFFWEKSCNLYFFKDKSRNLPKKVSVRLSALVERFFFSRMRNFSLSTWYLNINGCCKAMNFDQTYPVSDLSLNGVDAHVSNLSTIQPRELKFRVWYLREKSAPFTKQSWWF